MTADNRTAIPAPVTELLNSEAGQASANIPWRTAQLVEYYGLGNVVRYEHLEDTDNNTLRTLRVIDPAAPDGEQNLKLSEFTGWANWDFLNAED